ncbi:predicted protein [Coccidioides posadasii str. Silveira]|uniref:Predicted protein n=1 Tax=Coccidioides posadasii (strain RMSCC 757 / Silveira) TaxID=443226 RepID=E9CTW1_COCPS|nr:predicted protein [Coccidioides posadasii str. Silveira]
MALNSQAETGRGVRSQQWVPGWTERSTATGILAGVRLGRRSFFLVLLPSLAGSGWVLLQPQPLGPRRTSATVTAATFCPIRFSAASAASQLHAPSTTAASQTLKSCFVAPKSTPTSQVFPFQLAHKAHHDNASSSMIHARGTEAQKQAYRH